MRPSRWARIVVTRIDDDHLVRRIGEQSSRQVWDILLRDGDNDKVYATNGFWDRDSGRAGFGGQVGERFGTSRVCDKNLMSKRGEATGQCAANLACADDADLHVFILWLAAGKAADQGTTKAVCGRLAGTAGGDV